MPTTASSMADSDLLRPPESPGYPATPILTAPLPTPTTASSTAPSAWASATRCPRPPPERMKIGTLLSPSMEQVTRILAALEQGEPHAAEKLLPLVYDELRKLARQRLASEKPGQTLQPTALVHEAYLRLVDVEPSQQWH